MRNIPHEEIEPEDAAERFTELLRALGRRKSLRDPIAGVVEEFKMTPAQVHTIGWLGSDHELTMGELARRLGVSEKTMTGIIDRLQRDKLVERVRDDGDRRVVRVRLTPRGRKGFEKVDAMLRERITQMMSALDNEDRLALLRIVQKLHDRKDTSK